MILALVIAAPLAAGLIGLALRGHGPRWIALAALAFDLGLILGSPTAELRAAWIPDLGIGIHLLLDGLSLVLVLLTLLLGAVAVVTSWREVSDRVGFFHLNLMATLTGVLGVFLARDLILFTFFWELMLVPMAFLIGIFGHEDRVRAALKFFVFTQMGGLLMLVAILGLAFTHRGATGVLTFDADALMATPMTATTARWLFLGFFVGFAVKLPAVPLHTWLPDAHTEAPTGGSVILAGLLLKTGAYGLLRFAVPLFPGAAEWFTPYALTLGVMGVLWGAALAFAQTDLKRLVAYTSVSHLGFVLIGVFAGTPLALQGVVVEMVAHGLATGGLFVVAGQLQERLHTRDLHRMGGLLASAPRFTALALVLALAALGLPGLGSFVAELLVLLGTWPVSPIATVLAALGLVLATVYALWLIQKVFHGRPLAVIRDLGARETAVLATLVLALLWLGLFPQPMLDAAAPALEALR